MGSAWLIRIELRASIHIPKPTQAIRKCEVSIEMGGVNRIAVDSEGLISTGRV